MGLSFQVGNFQVGCSSITLNMSLPNTQDYEREHRECSRKTLPEKEKQVTYLWKLTL